MKGLPLVALGCALLEEQRKVREEGGQNRGVRVAEYLRNLDPPLNVAAPWCAAFVQFCSDVAARGCGAPNPLDAVKLEALVQSYYNWASSSGLLVPSTTAQPGDLVFYRFGAERWDHIGFVAVAPDPAGAFKAVEGNTNLAGSREGDGVFLKERSTRKSYPVAFARWA